MKFVSSCSVLIVLCAVLIPAAVFAEEPDKAEPAAVRDAKALEILEKVDAAAKAVKGVKYKARVTPGGVAAARSGPAEGEAVMSGWTGSVPQNFWVHVKTERQERPLEVTGGGNGEMFFVVDHATKKGYEDMDPGVMGGLANVLMGVAMLEFVHDTPFSDELNAAHVEYRGEGEAGGEPCEIVHVDYAPNFKSTWYFAKKDWLPRRRVQIFTTQEGEGTIDRVITDLVIDPKLEPGLFTMKLPEGFERVDDFAP